MALGTPEIIIIVIVILGIYVLFPIWGYRAGSKRTMGPIVGMLLGAVLGIIGIIIIYCTPRVKFQPFYNFQAESRKADELQKFKQLLDSGAITEEEYQTQKARILS
jgi:uncharacterized membrane protein